MSNVVSLNEYREQRTNLLDRTFGATGRLVSRAGDRLGIPYEDQDPTPTEERRRGRAALGLVALTAATAGLVIEVGSYLDGDRIADQQELNECIAGAEAAPVEPGPFDYDPIDDCFVVHLDQAD